MFKRLMISLVAVGLVAIFIAEAANAIVSRRRRSVGVTATSTNPGTFVTTVFGLPADGPSGISPDRLDNCGEVRGELYCAQNNSVEARLACDIATGDSAARVLVLDKDAIKANAPPNYFTEEEVNFDIKDFGQREQLRGFEERALSTEPAVYVISLPTGKKSNAGLHAITELTLSRWNNDGALTDDEALRRFVGEWDPAEGKFIPDDGFGINGEEFIHKVPGIVPLFGPDLDDIAGETICAAVKHAQVKGNPLKGKYLGLAAFKVLSRFGSLVEVEVLDADEVCKLPLYIETPASGVAGECLVANATAAPEAVVFAPAFPDGDLRAGEGKFPAVQGTLVFDGAGYKQTVEVILDDDVGQRLCEEEYSDNPDVDFVDFIPINRGGISEYANYAYIGLTESDNPDVADKKICSEGVEGGSRFICEDFEGEIPTCSFDCGPKYPDFLSGSTWATFLDDVGIGSGNCIPVDTPFIFEDEWEFAPVGTEAGHQLLSIREDGHVTTLFDSNDCASMGLYRRVNFDEENLVFSDVFPLIPEEIPLSPYNFSGFKLGIPGGVDIFMCEFQFNPMNPDPVLDYLPDPFTVEDGYYGFFFNDYHPSADYDDFILIGRPVSEP